MEEVCARFVSQKISKARWRPLPAAALQPPDLFATGSWDNEDNRISIWSVGDVGSAGLNGEYQGEPQLLCDIRHNGDVMDMQFLDQERIVVGSSTGSVTVFRHHQNNQTLSASHRWENAHYHADQYTACGGAACTGVICNNPEIVTVGEDGRINLYRADQKDAVRTIGQATEFHCTVWTDTPISNTLWPQGARMGC
uniref:Nucleoporin 43 n=1 Tax=Gallus gallus TaxID=9031 RepID=A0A8V0XPH3_CHICK